MSVQLTFGLIGEYFKLPRKSIRLATGNELGDRLYKSFNQRHQRLKVIRHKTIGVALIDLSEYDDYQSYESAVNGKNSAAYFSRRSAREGCSVQPINPHDFHDAILAVNLSAEERQGRGMDENYTRRLDYPIDEFNMYFGVFFEEQLIAYCWVVRSGELLLLNRLMGHKDHQKKGIMYQLIMHAVKTGFEQRERLDQPFCVMYDTYYGASEGLKMFKRRLGFRPYKVKWLRSC